MKKLGIVILIFMGTVTLNSCKSTASALSAQEKQELSDILESKNYRIEFTAAYPQNTLATQQVVNQIMLPTGNSSARIDIAGEGDFIALENGVAVGDLPFYGERRMGSSYNTTDVGINFNSKVTDYQVTEEDSSVKASFNLKGEDDSYQITITLFKSKIVSVLILSSGKTNMRYDGRLSLATEEK